MSTSCKVNTLRFFEWRKILALQSLVTKLSHLATSDVVVTNTQIMQESRNKHTKLFLYTG